MSTSPGSAKNNIYFYPCKSFRFSTLLVKKPVVNPGGGGIGFNLLSEGGCFACQYENCHGLAFSRTLPPPPPEEFVDTLYSYTGK